MRRWNFATLVTHGEEGINVTHLPFLVSSPDGDGGALFTHLAKANPQYRDLRAGAEALVLFQGPHAFVTPGWYGNMQTFPTWNYTAVHVRGAPRIFDAPEEVRALLTSLVEFHEVPLATDWKFAAMPEDLVTSRMRFIAGVEIPIRSIEGKMKLNQDKTPEDRVGVIAALEKTGDHRNAEVAALMRQLPDLAF